jgi:hypothetical protein
VIDFDGIDTKAEYYKTQFMSGIFGFVVIDDFCDNNLLQELVAELPDPKHTGIKKSRDYVFAKNKFEKSGFWGFGPNSNLLYQDMLSDRFAKILESITGEHVFVDPAFHGGGAHQGGSGSYLDMHADFNYHPNNPLWFRNLNILIYLNKDWKPEYGGQLKLENKNTNEATEVDPVFNRCVIMHTRDYTLHGYDPISFPEGRYRQSIAAYAYSTGEEGKYRSTTWYPKTTNFFKKSIGRHWPILVKLKTKILGSNTEKNK